MKNNTYSVFSSFESTFLMLKLEFSAWAPKIVNALMVMIIGFILAYFFKWLSEKLLKIGTSLLPKSIKNRKFIKENLASFILGISKVFFILVLFLSLTMSLKVLEMHMISDWLKSIGNYLPNIIGAILIIVLGWKIKDLIQETLSKALNNANINEYHLVSAITAWSVFIVSLFIALQQIGLDLSLIVTVSGIVLAATLFGVAMMFSLGAKDSIADILYCYQISRVIKIGNTIKLREFEGVVTSIGPIFILIKSKEGSINIPGRLVSKEILCISEDSKL